MGMIMEDYPCGTSTVPRRLIVAKVTRRRNRDSSEDTAQRAAEPAQIAPVGTSASGNKQSCGGEEVIMRDLNPPLLSDAERGEGDSTNSRMHKLIYGGKR